MKCCYGIAVVLALTSGCGRRLDLDIVAHRAGDRFGQPVTEELEDAGDPQDYVILVNDDASLKSS